MAEQELNCDTTMMKEEKVGENGEVKSDVSVLIYDYKFQNQQELLKMSINCFIFSKYHLFGIF